MSGRSVWQTARSRSSNVSVENTIRDQSSSARVARQELGVVLGDCDPLEHELLARAWLHAQALGMEAEHLRPGEQRGVDRRRLAGAGVA